MITVMQIFKFNNNQQELHITAAQKTIFIQLFQYFQALFLPSKHAII
jgi:hypothetical protein